MTNKEYVLSICPTAVCTVRYQFKHRYNRIKEKVWYVRFETHVTFSMYSEDDAWLAASELMQIKMLKKMES